MQEKWMKGILIALAVLLIVGLPISYYLGTIAPLSEIQKLKGQNQQLQQDLTTVNQQIQQIQQQLATIDQKLNLAQVQVQLMEKELVVTDSFFASSRAKSSTVGKGTTYLSFTGELKICPYYNLTEGEIQAFSVWVWSDSGVKEVKATIETNSETVTIQLKLVEGNYTMGRWVGLWIIRGGILNKTDSVTGLPRYMVLFMAYDRVGRNLGMAIAIDHRK